MSEIPSFVQPPTAEQMSRSRVWSSALRVVPDFIIIGAQKAGTTSLFGYLSEHPNIAPALAKEVHYFDYNYGRGEGWYRAHFPTVWSRWRGEFRLTGEASPYYLFYPHAAWRAHQLAPRAKLLVLLRNPVERAYSHYHHQVRFGVEPLTFEQAIEQEPARLVGEYEEILADPEYYSFNYQNYSYLARGMYANQLSQWFKYFPREQFLILPSEPFYANPGETFARVLDFLKLPHWKPEQYRADNSGSYEPMHPDTRAYLVDFFAPHNERLYDQLSMNFDWK